ncbi:hypothetical protein C7B62_20390 [Pleurocapsa sp. CCALA 161]|uniref:hypothetical protein n=1 Tax=Pleurocapsa sp. CCALA 161 TaxID=2107688 RepID=UPI000D070DEA|nr:hypothetical protein [Pleurocapsa sp. CCALA 161]PSB07276.1 hypothetical protein C7B62_20390 [Pleurocapsa sp. CCALA 161]
MNLLKLFTSVGLGLSFTVSNFPSNTVKAASIPTITYDMVGENNLSTGILEAPDFSSITFRSLGSFSEPGFISGDYDRYAGYALGRQWYRGDAVIDILKLGDIDDSFGVGRLKLGEIVAKSGRQSRDVTLDRFGFIKNQTISSFIKANPQLKERLIQDVPPLADAIALVYGDRGKALLELPVRVLSDRSNKTSEFSLNKNVKSLAQTQPPKFDISEFEMGNLDLSEYSLESVEGIGDSFVEDYEDWKDEHLSDIEGLADISFDDFPNPIATTLAFISRVDTIWSDAHGQIQPGQSVSGSNQAGYAVPCQQSCAHIELDDLENSGRDIRWISEGRRWMLGNDPNNANICPEAPWGVDGGEGILGVLNCGKEPTGRNPFGPGFKVALWSVDETKDEASTAIFFRICQRGIPDLGCTPYFIGPIPFLPANRENWIILGPGI